MRITAIILLVLLVVVGVAVLLLGRPKATAPLPQNPSPVIHAVNTNAAPATSNGFYVGKGDERVYLNYATPDPVLRSFLQSVMDASPDPNAQGKEIFLRICAVCHQRDGEGKDGVAPPLAASEWAITATGNRLIHISLNGVNGPIRVRGRDWNMSMPPWRENLSDDQLSVVLTYIRTQLGNNRASAITPEAVAAIRKETPATPETAERLSRLSD